MSEPVKSNSAIAEKARRLTPDELCEIAERMVAAKDPVEVERLKKEFERGFYGDEPEHA
jgi:hypothetical protein